MKRILTSTICSVPLAFASIAYAQTTPPPAADTPKTEAPARGTPDTTGTPATPGASTTPGTPATPGASTTPGVSSTPRDTGTMGTTPSGAVDDTTMRSDQGDATETIQGWSVKNSVMGESVYNENDEKIGDVTDVVITPRGEVTHIIVGAGGFLGMGQHDVAIPFDELKRGDNRLTLSGYTKDQLKALPKVDLAE